MAGRALDVSVLVRLVDRITGPLRAIQRAFDGFASVARRIGVLGAAIAAISFMGLIQQAAAFDQKLRDMVVTAGEFGAAAEARIKGIKMELFDLALQVGIAAEALADARSVMVADGLSDDLASRLLVTVGRVAKAASAVPNDVAKVASALSRTFNIPTDNMELALGKLVVAGKLGRFEFKDMARVIPALSASLKALGVTGMEAVATMGAALQVAMFGTDSADTAANNFKNFLDKLLSPNALKNFAKAGVDIQAVMTNALARGINPVEAALEKISKLTGTSEKEMDRIFKAAKGKGKSDAEAAAEVKESIRAILGRTKVGELFQDVQVLDFLVPFMLNKAKYLEFKKAIEAAGLDEMARDFKTQMAGLSTQVTIFNQILDIFKDRVGIAFGSNLGWINAGLIALLGYVKQVDAAFPGVIDATLSWGGAALVLVAGLGLLGPVFSVLGAGLGVIAAVIGAVLSPIGLLAAALVAAALVIRANWADFAPFFSQMWGGVTSTATAAVAAVKALFAGDWAGAEAAGGQMLAGLGRIGAGLMPVLTRVGSIIGNWALAQLPASMRQAVAQAAAAVADMWPAVSDALGGMADVAAGAVAAIRALFSGDWAGLSAAGGQMLAGLGRIGAGLMPVLTRVGSIIGNWALAQLPASMRQAVAQAAAAVADMWPAVSDALGGMADVAAGAVAAIRALFSGDWAGLSAAGGQVLAGFGRIGSGLLAVLGRLGSMLGPALSGLGRRILSALDGAFGGVPSQIVTILSGVVRMMGAFWSTVGGRLAAALAPAAAAVLEWAQGLPARILAAFGFDAGALTSKGSALLSSLWEGAKAQAAALLQWAAQFGAELLREMSSWSAEDWTAMGTALGNKVADAVKAVIDGLVSWFSGLPGRILSAIGAIDLSSIIKWPSMPSWLGGGASPPAAGANDNAPPAAGQAPAASPPPAAQKTGFAPVPGRSFAAAGFAPAAAVTRSAALAPAPQEPVTGRIVVEAAPGAVVREASSDNPNVPIVAGQGRVVGRA